MKIWPFLVLVLLLPACAGAEIYQWTDSNGRVHFSDSATNTEGAKAVRVEVNTYAPPPALTPREANKEPGPVPPKVVMYATSGCPYCVKARKYFRAHQIPFVEYDIEKDAKAKAAYDAIGGRGVPVILVGNKRLNGFSEPGFAGLYAQ